jgi:4-hydroxythreonine-4-phosphate dehydrogenase
MKPLLVTVGEPAGIGADCILRAWQQHPEAFSNAIISAPASWLHERAGQIGVAARIQEHDELAKAQATGAMLRCWNPLPGDIASRSEYESVRPGQPSLATAGAVIHCIESAARACLNKEAAALVTGPIEKAVLRRSGFGFPGHTEFLAHLAADSDFVMMLASEQLRVALLTTHLALRDVPAALSTAATLDCLRIVHREMRHRFGIDAPRLGLCALNPHAGEQGHFGREEIEILAPAAAAGRREGIDASEPLPADTIFSAAMRKNFDAIVCCYHDQALIPIKALSFGNAVNVTLGLPFIRTSVDHGTALDRAGSGQASYNSLLAAIRMAKQMSG